MRGHSQQMESARVVRIGVADQAVEAFSVDQTSGAMMSHRCRERLFGTAPCIHGDAGLRSIAGPISSEAEIHLAGASIDPDRLIAGQRTRRPVPRVARDVQGRMRDEPAAIWSACNNVRIILNNVGAVMVVMFSYL